MTRNELALPQSFNAKRPGSLVGTMTASIELLEQLYRNTAGDEGGGRTAEACPSCVGRGANIDIMPARMIASELSLKQGAVLLWAGTVCGPVEQIKQLANRLGIVYDRPLDEQDARFADILLYGYADEPVSYVYKKIPKVAHYRGCVNDLRAMRDAGTTSAGNRRAIDYFSGPAACEACGGTKRHPDRLAAAVEGLTLAEALRMPAADLLGFVRTMTNRADGGIMDALEPRLVYLAGLGLRKLFRG